ncbi:MAG: HAD superfamily hydrolase (TIGR01509 family) [Gammaproteobacteria bacterium]|jgi:HAD superfamily hydrolase (TIGR01509 family)
MSPQVILLDLGGVLIDVDFERSLRHWFAAARHAPSEPNKRTPNRNLVAKMATDVATDKVTAQVYERHERGEISFSEFTQALAPRLQLELNEEQWQRGWNAALGDALPGALDLVRSAATRWPVYLFSNTNATHHTHWKAQQRELLSPMRDVFVSNTLGLRKPDPLAYRQVAERIGLDPQRIVFFDDRKENVDGAKLAGLKAFQADKPSKISDLLGLH